MRRDEEEEGVRGTPRVEVEEGLRGPRRGGWWEGLEGATAGLACGEGMGESGKRGGLSVGAAALPNKQSAERKNGRESKEE